ncbi:hypothetical protein EV193_11777 [Herbihabitans rhizosphaerae]|uniref:Uncharacterized protein n=1 Tax=Herbihabitans rhizosphaerae TaxID=1872711 RepID=A0A4Q7KDE3_9PSEU|nr:hypothetical protein [Herbihabitans rhizosphaerae]RZS30379.1 hypothetical protein EV193_11777 [Herbihabitans rhizosphaerae]
MDGPDKRFQPHGGATAGGAGFAPASMKQMTDDADKLRDMAAKGSVAVDPVSAKGIADAYDQMVDEIYWIKIGMLTAGQHPKLGSSPYATRVAKYQHEAAESFLDTITQLETACKQCARAFRDAAKHYVERERDAVDTFNKAGRQGR